MTFTPQNFDGNAAAQRMIARGTAPHLSCLETVADAIKGDVSSDSPGSYGMAIDGWNRAPADRRHPYTTNMPPGMAFYASTANRPDGHVVITLGGDRVVSTDTPSAGYIGVTTVAELVDRMGITPLGWTDWFLGHNLITTSPRRRRKTMFLFDIPNPKATPAYPRLYVIVTPDGREASITTGSSTFIAGLEAQFGTRIITDRALVDSVKAQLRATAPTPVADPAIVTSLKSILTAIRSLTTSITTLTKNLKK